MYVLHNVAKGSPSRADFVHRAGNMQVPYLADPNTQTEMFESADIIAYLDASYGVEDVNGDGELDLLVKFKGADTGIVQGDTEACLSGQTFQGQDLSGCDAVTTVDPPHCGLGAELAFLLPPLLWIHRRRSVRSSSDG